MPDTTIDVRITVGDDLRFGARLEHERAPATCAAFLRALPLRADLIQARWSGEAAWVPLGARDFGVGREHATGHPAPGALLLYPAGVSETEILVPYGRAAFACRDGALEGNHFLTIVEGMEGLAELGRRVVWEGRQTIEFARA